MSKMLDGLFVKTFGSMGFWDVFIGVKDPINVAEIANFAEGPSEEVANPIEFVDEVLAAIQEISGSPDAFCVLFDNHGLIFSKSSGKFLDNPQLRREFFEYVRLLS